MTDKTTRTKVYNAIQAFDKQELNQASLGLFQALGYDTSRQRPLDKPTYQGFKDEFIEEGDRFDEQKAMVQDWQYVNLLFQLTDDEFTSQVDLFSTGQVNQTRIESYLFMAIQLKNKPYKRTDLTAITRQVNQLFPMPVMLLFKHGQSFTLSVINRRVNKRDENRDVLEKVSLIKDININDPHRAHVDILSELGFENLIKTQGVTNFVSLHRAWLKTLDIEELNRKFYNEISGWYYYAIKTIKLPHIEPEYSSDNENVKYFAIRLISRLIFTWFLKEQGLISKKLLELNSEEGDPSLLKGTTYKDFLSQNSYYRGILQNIFFGCLNTPLNQRKGAEYGKWYLSDHFNDELLKTIPYLNGGLFDKLEEDNCNDRFEDDQLSVPNELFYAHQLTAKVDNKKRVAKGINRIMEQYKFTVDENTSFEEEVALDPELLGRIFENLLAEVDPDEIISKSARRATGSFYTPRKVIDYMVTESLYKHLQNYFKNRNWHTVGLEQLVYQHQADQLGEAQQIQVVQALDDIRVLDPACGSGAFPMGMLHKMVTLLEQVDPNNKKWIENQLNRVAPEVRDTFRQELLKHDLNYARKLGIIRNSIYGLDNQPLAVMITKLRFFISLVIEQDINPEDLANNYHISELPNLETKILCADTLRENTPQSDIFQEQAFNEFKEAKVSYYQNKEKGEEHQEQTLNKVIQTLAKCYPRFAYEATGTYYENEEDRRVQNEALIKKWFKYGKVAAPFFNMDAFFPELEGKKFDIVIGNPPYGGDKLTDQVRKNLNLESKDRYGAFIARFLPDGGNDSPLKHQGILAYIVSDTFMTIKSHRKLRAQMMDNYIHKMIRVHPDTFKATVNTAIVLCERNQFPFRKDENGSPKVQKQFDDAHQCLMADLTNINIHDNYDRFLELLYKTTKAETQEAITKEGKKGEVLHMNGEDWQLESSEEYAIYQYPQTLINSNSNQPFFVASPKLFAFMNDTNASKKEVKLENEVTVKAREIAMNGKTVPVVKLDQIAEVKVGLQTGDNPTYLFQKSSARGSYKKIEDYEEYLLTEEELDTIRNNEQLRQAVIEHGISTNDPQSERYFEGKYIIPHDKGGESDVKTGWLPNYFVPTNYYIDWSEWAINRMKTHKDSNGKLKSRYQNSFYYFKIGIDYSQTGFYSPTFRINSGANFNTEATSIFTIINTYYLLGILNSKSTKFFIKCFIDHTIHASANKLKEAPIYFGTQIPNLKELVIKIIEKQKENPRYDYLNNEQNEIDRLVYEAYGLNEEDIQEVENWYARKYPKLVEAQRRRAGEKEQAS